MATTPRRPHPPGPSRRQLLGGGLAAAAGAVTLSACSGPLAASVAGARSNPDGVTFWNLFTGGDGENMVAMEQAFTKADPGIPLEATTLAWGDPYYTKLALATAGGQPPDVAITHLTRMPLLADAGILTPLDDLDLAAEGITADRFTPAAWDRSHQGGRLYAVPIDTHPFVLYYNVDAARQVGLLGNDDVLVALDDRDTFVDALTQLKAVTGEWGGVVTIIADPATNWRWFTTLYLQAGGQILTDDGADVVFDADRAGDVLDFMTSLTGSKGLLPPAVDPPGTTSLFGSGKAGFLLDGEWQVPTYEAAGTPFGVVPVPTIGGADAASFADSHALVIPRSDNRSATTTAHALRFVRSMLDNSLTWAEGGHIPAWLPVQDSDAFRKLSPQANYVQAAYDAAYDPKAWYTGSGSNFQTTLGSSISSAQSGQMSVSAAVAQMSGALRTFATTRPPVG